MNRINRLHFLKLLLAGAALAPGASAFAGVMDSLRGDRVGWARLKTPSPHWMRHSGSDSLLTTFFKEQTTLNIDPAWYVADVNNLSEMCQYPFLFSQGIQMVTDAAARNNVAEYIRRGGFLLLDACCHREVTPSFDDFILQNRRFFASILPDSQSDLLPPTHDLYRCHFQIPNGHPPHTFMAGVYDAEKEKHGLVGVTIGQRMVAVISVCGLECGWDHVTAFPVVAPAGHDQACMRMVTNIYIYAMMQGA
jgi:hypothetical protein